jgi:hypothetical protein
MELNQFVTQDNADAGIWIPVELYGKKCDFDLLILGNDADKVQQHERKSLKKLKNVMSEASRNKDVEFNDDTIDELTDSNNEAVLVRIAGIRGWKVERKGAKEISRDAEDVTLNGEKLTSNEASYKLLITKIPAIKEFVLKVSRDRTNFLLEPSRN